MPRSITPFVSFVAATLNRGPVLVDCLRRTIANAGLPRERFELIVVDNASRDGTGDLVARELPEVNLIRLPRNEGPVAKNHGIRAARGSIVVLLDDDAYPMPGTIPQMLRHFAENPHLAAAVCDVILPDGSHEACAYPDVFIGAGTGLRKAALDEVGLLPADFFMAAEEYDLSWRLLDAGYRVQRFEDLPLVHLKTPGARFADRITRLDVRNNLYLLARYVPAPLCHELAAEWLTRYFRMALARDRREGGIAHKKAFMCGAAEGLGAWTRQRQRHGRLRAETIERIFRFEATRERLARVCRREGIRRVLFADWGKNLLAYYRAAQAAGVAVAGIAEEQLAAPGVYYRDVPVLTPADAATLKVDAVIVSNLNPVQAPRRAAAWARLSRVPVLDLFSTAGAAAGAMVLPERIPTRQAV